MGYIKTLDLMTFPVRCDFDFVTVAEWPEGPASEFLQLAAPLGVRLVYVEDPRADNENAAGSIVWPHNGEMHICRTRSPADQEPEDETPARESEEDDERLLSGEERDRLVALVLADERFRTALTMEDIDAVVRDLVPNTDHVRSIIREAIEEDRELVYRAARHVIDDKRHRQPRTNPEMHELVGQIIAPTYRQASFLMLVREVGHRVWEL